MSGRIAIIAGVTGLVGRQLLDILLESVTYVQVIVLVRRKLNLQHVKLEQVVVDFDNLSFNSHLKVDDFYCTLGTTIKKAGSQEAFRKVDLTYPVQLTKLFQQHGLKRFLIVTAMGADPSSRIFYNQVKGEVEEQLRLLGLPHLFIFKPSLLLGIRQEFRLGERLAAHLSRLFSWLMVGQLKKYKPIEAKKVALAMYHSAISENVESYKAIENDAMHKVR